MGKHRGRKFKNSVKEIINDFSNHIYGSITIIGLIITILFSVLSIRKPTLEMQEILLVLVFCNLLFSVIIFSYSIKYSKLQKQSESLLNYQIENYNLKVLLQLQADTFHNINHYYRSLLTSFDEVLDKIKCNEAVNQNEIDYICELNNQFLIILTSSLQNYFSIHTDENCSISIKVLNPVSNKIKTLYRDPVNFKKRRQSEIENNIYIFDSSENTAFSLILDKKQKDIIFYSDNLQELYDKHKYNNINPNWYNLYNSTIVTPISKNNRKQGTRHIVGFLTADNKGGNLIDNTTIEIMWAISDLLYNYMQKFNSISSYTIKNNLKNERAEDFIF